MGSHCDCGSIFCCCYDVLHFYTVNKLFLSREKLTSYGMLQLILPCKP